jgi:hypothetical protein
MKNKKYVSIFSAILLFVVILIYLLGSDTTHEQLSETEQEQSLATTSTKGEQAATIPILESGVELGTDGVVTKIDLSGVVETEPALVTIKTDANSLYTIAVPVSDLATCEAQENIADVYGLIVGDKISVRGTTDAQGRVVTCANESHQLKARGVYQDSNVGLSFTYKKSPDGYRLETEGYNFSSDPAFISGVVLTDENDAAELLSSTVPREGPPTIKLLVYENPDELSPTEWAKANPLETAYSRALAEAATISVGRREAIGYTVDGLYLTDVYIVTYNKKALIIMGEYIDFESEIFKDVEQLVASIVFTE